MELRLLRYFLAVANAGSFTRAAEALFITQPTLSRQIAQLEQEMGTELFHRGGKRLRLTEKGVLLRRRAQQIVELSDKAREEMMEDDGELEGTISIGWGDLASVSRVAKIIKSFSALHPSVTFDLFTATADDICERMERGLTDIGLLLEPVDVGTYDFIRLNQSERFVVLMAPDDPLAAKRAIAPDDLVGLPLLLPRRAPVHSELAHWFGDRASELDVRYRGNLPASSAIMAMLSAAYPIIVEGGAVHWNKEEVVTRPLDPDLRMGAVLAWRRDQPLGAASRAFVAFARSELSLDKQEI